jgi:hypothetical protein
MQTEMFNVDRISNLETSEVWVECPKFQRYLVSSFGRFKHRETGFIMKGIKASNGYPIAQLTLNKKQHAILAHRLVCEAFHGPSPAGKDLVNHIDGNRANNNASNLEWVSRRGNARHMWASVRSRKREEMIERYVTCHNSV